MLEGITILNQSEIMTKPEWTQTVAIISMILMLVFLFASLCFLITDKEKLGFAMSLLMILSAIASLTFITLEENIEIPTGKYEYQVIIDDNVSLNEFIEKYEIINIDGKLYTIKEKED